MKSIVAICTGDIAGSSRLNTHERKVLEKLLWEGLALVSGKEENFTVQRGDAFQVLFEDPGTALAKMLELRCLLQMGEKPSTSIFTDARISIGTGSVSLHGRTLNSSDGSAFQRSGRSLEEIKNSDLFLKIDTGNENFNAAFEAISAMMDDHIRNWSGLQAEAVLWRLRGFTFEKISDKLGINPSAVYKRIDSSHWKVIKKGVDFYEFALKKLAAE